MTNTEARAYDPARQAHINRLEAQIKELDRAREVKVEQLRALYAVSLKGV